MTSLLDRAAAPTATARAPRAGWAVAEHLGMLSLLIWWALPMTRNVGGRGSGEVPVALLISIYLLLATRSWRHASALVLVLSMLTSLASLTICVVSPSGWGGANDAASYGLAALAVPCTVSYARTAERRLMLVVAIVTAGLIQFTDAWLPWWSSGDPSRVMTGTFYWWNPFAAYLIPAVLLGAALFVHQRRAWAIVGGLIAPLAFAGIVFSSSRACLAVAAAGLLALLISAISETTARRKVALARWVAVLALAVAAPVALSGPPFFSHRVTPLSASDARTDTGETLSQNGTERVLFWRQSLAVFKAHPVGGGGYHTLATASEGLVDGSGGVTPLAHNGYLQVLSDGGLLLGLPFLLGCLGVLTGGARRMWSAARTRDERWLRIAIPLTLGGLALHSAVDFDWSHPSNLLMTALVAGLALALPLSQANTVSNLDHRSIRHVAVGMLVVLALTGAFAQHRWDRVKAEIASTRHASPTVAAARLHELGARPFADDRFAIAVLTSSVGSALPADQGVAAADIRWAVDATRRPAEVDRFLQLERAKALLVLGDRAGAEQLRQQALSGLPAALAGVHADASAEIMAGLGHAEVARALLEPFLVVPDAHAGAHLKVLLLVADGHYTNFDRCAYADAKSTGAVDAGTPFPGAVPTRTSCPNVLAGAQS